MVRDSDLKMLESLQEYHTDDMKLTEKASKRWDEIVRTSKNSDCREFSNFWNKFKIKIEKIKNVLDRTHHLQKYQIFFGDFGC